MSLDDLKPIKTVQVIGPDRWIWMRKSEKAYYVIAQLEKLRNEAIAKQIGTFEQAWAQGGQAHAERYLDKWAEFITVEDLLAVAFGDPVHYKHLAEW